MYPDRYTVSTPKRVYTVTDDLLSRWQMILAGRVLSDASNLPPSNYTITVDNPAVYVKIATDGFFALAARPEIAFPDLASTSYSLVVSIQAQHYLPTTLTVSVPSGSILPLGNMEVRLDYESVRLQGQVVMAVDNSPVGAAPVRLVIPTTLTLRTPLHFEHTSGTTVRACTFTSVGGVLSLAQPVTSISNRLVLSSAAGLVADQILRLGNDHQWEYMVVDGAGTQPNEVLLRGGLRRSFATNTPVQRVNSSPSAGSASLASAVTSGRGLLPLSSALVATHIQIQDADPDHVEFHTLDVLTSSQTEDRGYYILDGIQGVLSFDLQAQNPAGTHTAETVLRINPIRPVQTCNLRLSAP